MRGQAGMLDLAEPQDAYQDPQAVGIRQSPDLGHWESPAGRPGLQAPGGREAGDSPPSALLPGLVGVQTSDTHILTEISFSAASVAAANRLLAQAARLRRMKIVVGTHADRVRDHFAAIAVRCQGIMVTLTYADADSFNARQITEYVKRMRRWLEVRGISYAYQWVLEMQQRGAPHYHVLWWVADGTRLPMPDCRSSRQRKPLWPWGLTRIEKARCGPAYITKYASKGDHGRSLPRNARLFGIGGVEFAKRSAHWRALPQHVREQTADGDSVRRAPGGGWLATETGEYFPALWERIVEFRDGQWRVTMRKIALH